MTLANFQHASTAAMKQPGDDGASTSVQHGSPRGEVSELPIARDETALTWAKRCGPVGNLTFSERIERVPFA